MIQGDAQDIANQIRMERQLFNGAFVIVEGFDDRQCLEQHVLREQVEVIVAQNKDSVIDIVDILGDDGFRGVLGIVDADFDRITASLSTNDNIVVTDYHDLVMTHIMSSPLEDVIVEYGSSSKIAGLKDTVLDLLLKSAVPIGCLRLHSLQADLNLRFSDLTFNRFINRESLVTDHYSLIAEVKNKSQRFDIGDAELEEGMLTIKDNDYPVQDLCCGEDVIEILSVGFRRVLGNQNAYDVRPESLKRALRLAMPTSTFCSSTFGRSLIDWQNRNPPYRLFRRM